jgi:hypothetical protein
MTPHCKKTYPDWSSLTNQDTQRIVCAANRNKKTGLVICGARHFDYIMQNAIAALDQSGEWVDCDQGFIDQWGNFIDRKQAWRIALRQGQLKTQHASKTLYSEDLY